MGSVRKPILSLEGKRRRPHGMAHLAISAHSLRQDLPKNTPAGSSYARESQWKHISTGRMLTWGRKPRLALTPDQPFPQTSPGSGAGSALHQPRRHVPAPRIPGPSAVAWRIAGACYRAAGVTGERPRRAGPFLAIGLALVITLAGRQPGMTEPGGPLSPRR
jgi:hypothetical protein